MTIKILDIQTDNDEVDNPVSRTAIIAVSDGTNEYKWARGGLPLTGNLQTLLEAEEAELFAAAQARGDTFDVFNVRERAIIKAFALVVLDEINLLRDAAGLTLRDESQIRGAIKNKLG